MQLEDLICMMAATIYAGQTQDFKETMALGLDIGSDIDALCMRDAVQKATKLRNEYLAVEEQARRERIGRR